MLEDGTQDEAARALLSAIEEMAKQANEYGGEVGAKRLAAAAYAYKMVTTGNTAPGSQSISI